MSDSITHAPIGVGIVGLSATDGWAARAHVPALAAVDGLELRGLVASSAATGRAASATHRVPAHASARALAAEDGIDLVVVAVKVPEHRALVLPALEAGAAVLCEWPLAVDLREAEDLERAGSRTRTFVGLQGRTTPTFRWLADLVREGFVGEVLSATVVAASVGWGDPTSERARYTLDRGNGATLLTIAFGHMVDAVALVVGEPETLVATTATRRPLIPHRETGELVTMTAEDQIAVSGTLAGGAVFSAHHRGGAVSPSFSLLVDGTEGRLEVTAPGHPHLAPVTVRGARGEAHLAQLVVPERLDPFHRWRGTAAHPLVHAYAAIRDDLLEGTGVAPDFTHAARRHRLLDAIQRSAATGRRVSLA
ncbi:Gfo/Idh/MocA family protein [Conexibacter sp. SYSU D00693]|uniref:Gfo/Idh/MocA family protein n=1 Tax=Conexibacter sp. SYSU D00693 TaxID=2812560 RepID=UPI00196A205B|nr:Gfo/Idh/MocA family oxidoreductase [Conexibacter sp. SYSU D00693]